MAKFLFLILLLPGLCLAAERRCSIGVDVGHDRYDFGTRTARGLMEWQFNLQVATALYDALRKAGIDATLLNADGRRIPLAERPQFAVAAGATLFVAIHHDSAQDRYMSTWQWHGEALSYSDLFSGYGLFVSKKNPQFDESLRVAEDIGGGLLDAGLHPSLHHSEQIPGEGRPLLDDKRGVYQFDDLVVLKTATIPAVLVEVGVVINRDEELLVATPAYRRKITAAIVGAARAHCARYFNRAPR